MKRLSYSQVSATLGLRNEMFSGNLYGVYFHHLLPETGWGGDGITEKGLQHSRGSNWCSGGDWHES